jgi:phytoene synthase
VLDELVRIKDNKELIQYSYLVAGTVGIMMADILGVKNKLAKKYALDLGIAMQLTNICRDVLNDANLGRIYLPENYFGEVNIKNIIGKEADEKKIFETVKNIINLAEKYYNSGNLGIAFIPKESKFAIFLASNLYRAIGIKIIKHGFSNFLKRRAYLTILEKIFITIQSYILFLFRNKFNKFPIKHSSALHASIKNLINARI